MKTKKCLNCGKEFTPRQFNQSYCCRSCAKHSNYLKEKQNKNKSNNTKICVICKKEFKPRVKTQILCGSESCKRQNSQKRLTAFRNKQKNKHLIIKKCIICGTEFETNNNQQILCNKKECHKERAYREKKEIPEEKYPDLIGVYNFNTKESVKVCPVCKKEFITNVWNQKYCCKKCKDTVQIFKRPNNLFIERVCVICGKTYLPKSGKQATCSEQCKEELKKINNKRHNDKKPRKKHEPIKCKYCNETFIPQKNNQIFCCKEHQKKYYKETNYSSIKGKKYYTKNKETITKKQREYYYKNKSKILERGRLYRIKRQATDPDYVMKKRVREQVRHHLRKNRLKKNFHTFDLLGYTVQDLNKRLESLFEQNSLPDREKLSWDNMGTVWDIDHIIPCAYFTFVDENCNIDENAIKECWALSNLQPMYKDKNIAKSSIYEGYIYIKGKAKYKVNN